MLHAAAVYSFSLLWSLPFYHILPQLLIHRTVDKHLRGFCFANILMSEYTPQDRSGGYNNAGGVRRRGQAAEEIWSGFQKPQEPEN